MNLALLTSVCFTAGWFWVVIFGARGESPLAVLGGAFFVLFQLYVVKIKDIGLYIQDLLLVVFSLPLGVFLETFFIQAGLLHYPNTGSILPPIWVVSIYPLSFLLLNHSVKAIKRNYFMSFVVGFLAAPLNYAAESYLGGVTFLYSSLQTLTIIGVCWGIFLCLFSKIANIIAKAAGETLADRDSGNTLKLLYDGECPICNREICVLRKKDSRFKIRFLDISSKDFKPSENNDIDWKTAMSQIHAIDSEGNLLVGIKAFAAVYARCQLLIISTLMRIPFIESLLKPLYHLFAKNRLLMTGRSDANSKK